MAAPPPAVSRMHTELGQAYLKHKHAFLALAGFSLVTNLLGLVPSLYMLQVYDRVLTSRNHGTLWAVSLIALGLLVLLAALEWVRAHALIRIGNSVERDFNQRLFSATFQQSLRTPGANAAQALGDFTAIRQFVTGNGAAFFDLPWAPIYLAVCFLLHPLLGFVALAGLVVSVLLALVSSRLTQPALDQAQKSAIRASLFASNNLRNAEAIQAMGMLGNMRARWARFNGELLRQQSLASDRAAVMTAISKNFRIAMQSVILGTGAWLVIEGTATPGAMIAASILMGRALGPVDQAIGAWKQVVATRAAWDRLTAILQAHAEPAESLSLPAPRGVLTVEGLVAAPPGAAAPVLKGVSFAAQPGEVTGVVGPSASGKSTLARLLVGVWPGAAGKVRLDGADVFAWNKLELGPHLGYLPQDVEIFEGTVAENICRFGALDSERIVAAAQMAGVHEMILRLPQGYETPLGVGGSALSAGQRQRVALARALYGEPALVVLDEPNSNLDEAGDAALLQALRRLKQLGKTVVVVTHRSQVLQAVDKLLLLNDGQVVAFGPRDAVLQKLAAARGDAGPRAPAPGALQADPA
ncbi:type I secretion system permease/ATPase [Ramlibacter sp. B156]|uniref:Type I secretion system permease/ATPase n=2 Tax=Ramlibacter montanisoli TaxID=2732512 RepID=A0A849KIM8_9BURK|nr:type I secretion system permease/ATPase [Ramlibacter montanisoli]